MNESNARRAWLLVGVIVLSATVALVSWDPTSSSSDRVTSPSTATLSAGAASQQTIQERVQRATTVPSGDSDAGTTTPSGTQTPNTPAPQPTSPPDSPIILDINEQVATEDGTVAVRGVAHGPNRVLVSFVDRRGGYASTILKVDDNNEFEDDDVPLVTLRGEPMAEGLVVASVFAVGRDGVVGDGEIRGFTRADLKALDENTRQQILARLSDRLTGPGLTQQQVLELLFAQSVGEAGSDDLGVGDTFVLTDGQTTIEAVVPASAANTTAIVPLSPGDTMVVQGLTNRKPDDTTIFVEVVDGPSAPLFDLVATKEWGTDGVWSIGLQIPPGAKPGTYTLRADDGDDTDMFQVVIPAEPTRGQNTGT